MAQLILGHRPSGSAIGPAQRKTICWVTGEMEEKEVRLFVHEPSVYQCKGTGEVETMKQIQAPLAIRNPKLRGNVFTFCTEHRTTVPASIVHPDRSQVEGSAEYRIRILPSDSQCQTDQL
ncbi:hypothetical protein AXG93_4413s1120 [Marchantia polymorpha subsp. ruderalis]|uniref:Uncharacterized protein n=1 Tax=Marchantia polymorpha subsp. ruderalis TaxID=1480154 RepID=A0A176W1I6_MARPO|nr:hypothetical protein AXG93_4413s1120 [Marchantia polymorpha subsp. ruderalis]